MKEGDIIVCIDKTNRCTGITIGGRYELVRISEIYSGNPEHKSYIANLWIIDDSGEKSVQRPDNFIELKKFRNSVIDDIIV